MHENDIYCLTETWLNDGFYSHEFFDKTFKIFRRDRSATTYCKSYDDETRGGGVLIAIKNSQNYKIIHQIEWQCDFIEDVWITIIPSAGKRIHICCCYIPGATPADSFEKYFSSLTDKILALQNDDVILVGDQNVPEFYNGMLSRGTKYNSLIDFMDLCGVQQHNEFTNNISNTVLDLIFSNCHLEINYCNDPLVQPDLYHPPILLTKKISPPPREKEVRVFRNWKTANWQAIRESLHTIDWDLQFVNCQNVDELVDVFYDVITSILNMHCPLIVKKVCAAGSKISQETNRLLRKKRKAHNRWIKSSDPKDFTTLQELKLKCEESAANDEKKNVESAEDDLQKNPKKFFSFIKNLKSNGAGIAEFVHFGDKIATNKTDAVNLFAQSFASVFSQDDTSKKTDIAETTRSPINSWEHIHIPYERIHSKLTQLNTNKCAGPDGLPPALYKKCANAMTMPLFIIFNASLTDGVMPKKWKQAYVTPIHKNGSHNDVRNYRPISKLSICAKILDSLVADDLFNNFRSTITEHQHGFFRGRSTVTNLLGYTDKIQMCVGSGGQYDVIYTDFSKAFDTVSHNILLSKLQSNGICGRLLAWFDSYLKGRTLRVQIDNVLSDPVNVTSSVVQGSHCGPILFAIFINDIADILDENFNCYADDVKIFSEINSPDDCHKLQEKVKKLEKFSRDNGLKLNAKKCVVLSLTRRTKKFICHDYTIDNLILERKNEMKDLGVIFNGSCTFNTHIDTTCRKSKRALGFVIRNSRDFKNYKTTISLYNSFVKSILEYASPIWSPTATTHIKQIESIQHKFIRFIAKKYFNDTSESVDYKFYERKLNLQSLELRRIHNDINFTIKSFNGKVDSETFINEFGFLVPRFSSRSQKVFQISSTPSAIGRMKGNFNTFLNDADALSTPATGIKSKIESNFASLKN